MCGCCLNYPTLAWLVPIWAPQLSCTVLQCTLYPGTLHTVNTSVVIYTYYVMHFVTWSDLRMVFDSSGSSAGSRAVWMENVMSPGQGSGMRSLPPYQPPPTPSRYNYPSYTSPWLVRVRFLSFTRITVDYRHSSNQNTIMIVSWMKCLCSIKVHTI